MLAANPAWGAAAGSGDDYDRPERTTLPSTTPRQPEPTYRIEAGRDGDVFPAFANYASLRSPEQRSWGVVSVFLNNPTELPVRERVSVIVPGWSDEEIQTVDLAGGASRKLIFAPAFHARLYENREIIAASAKVKITDTGAHLLYSATVPLRLRAAEDMFWGARFQYAPFIASWVTPHDTRVEQVLGRAKEGMPGRRLPGYEPWKTPLQQEKSTRMQARVIYNALQQWGVSYVKSSFTLGNHQSVSERVRTPHESIEESSANCIDGSVLFASAFENLGMQPIIVLVPGHAYVGVKLAEKLDQYLYIDTSLVGRVPFESAINIAEKGLARLAPTQITRISIAEAREAGIYPMPLTK